MKTYQSYQAEAKQAEAKLKVAENQRLKIEQAVPKEKLDKSKKVRLIGKEVQKVTIESAGYRYSHLYFILFTNVPRSVFCYCHISEKEQIF